VVGHADGVTRFALAALALGACSETTATPTQYDAVAHALGASLAADLAGMADAVALARGTVPAGFTQTGDAAAGTALGIDYRFTVTCAPACGAADQADVTYAWSGAVALPATVTRAGAWTLAGLDGATANLAGSAAVVDDATIDGTSFRLEATATYKAFAIDVATGVVTAGTIALALTGMQATGSGAVSFAVSAAIAVGAGSGAIVLDGSRDYTVELATGAVTAAGSP
jgi:hypothetical protein